jgi:hypothetical protein
MKRLLIVCPLFPPATGVDCHRARLVAPILPEHGWQPEILAVDPRYLAVPQDAWLSAGVNSVPVHRARALSLRWTKFPGLGTLTYRARPFVRQLGNELLRKGSFEMVYFSTTSFGLTTLGPYWKAKYGVPYVVDYQDPWITDYYRIHPDVIPPGGKLKYAVVEWLSNRQEPIVLRKCSGITAVSSDYPRLLLEKYPFLAAPSIVIPFPGSQRDFERVSSEKVTQSIFDPNDGSCHWVCMGASGPIMFKVLRSLFQCLAKTREQGLLPNKLKLHFIGTSYAAAGTGSPVIAPLADQYGLGEIVHEQTDRVPYSTALKCLLDSDAVIATGSNDPTYNASKLLPYILAQKPFLAIFHRDSPASQLLRTLGGATHIEFATEDEESHLANKIKRTWIEENSHRLSKAIHKNELTPFTDHGQARLLSDFFTAAL